MQLYSDIAVDKYGNVQSGVEVTVKDSSGATATIYEADGVTEAGNPVTTDSNGEYSFKAANGIYTLVVDGLSDHTAYLYDPTYALQPSSQPVNAFAEIVAPNDGAGTYIDNVLTLENRSQNGSNQRGNAAIRFRDALTGYERGAMGYSALATDNPAFYGGNLLYCEIGNLSTDAQDTDFAVVNTHVSGNFYNYAVGSYKPFEVVGSTGTVNLRAAAPTGGSSHIGEGAITLQGVVSLGGSAGNEALRANSHLTASNWIDVYGADAGGIPYITAGASSSDSSLAVRAKGTGSLFLGGRGVTTLQLDTVASQVNFWQMYGGGSGAAVSLTPFGSDSDITANIFCKGANGRVNLAPNSAVGLSVGNPNNAVVYGTVTGAATGGYVTFGTAGETNVDLALSPAGTGVVRFGTRTAIGAETVTGYITIKDSGGTTRKLAVVS